MATKLDMFFFDKILAQDMSQTIDWVQIAWTAAHLMVGDNDVYERTLI